MSRVINVSGFCDVAMRKEESLSHPVDDEIREPGFGEGPDHADHNDLAQKALT